MPVSYSEPVGSGQASGGNKTTDIAEERQRISIIFGTEPGRCSTP